MRKPCNPPPPGCAPALAPPHPGYRGSLATPKQLSGSLRLPEAGEGQRGKILRPSAVFLGHYRAWHAMILPRSTQSMVSPVFTPSPTTTTVLPSGPVAAMQSPLPSSFAQVISVATARVETRHSTAMAPPTVFPNVRNIGFSLFLADVRPILSFPLCT